MQWVTGLCLILTLAGPYWTSGGRGRDVVFVVDRSRSMPVDAQGHVLEWIRLVEQARRAADRVGVVAFGADVKFERTPSSEGAFTGFEQSIDRDGSDIAAGIDAALTIVPEGRPGAILLASDGESRGGDAEAAARRAYGRGIPVFTRLLRRPLTAELAIERIDVPDTVESREPFQFTVWVWSEARVRAPFRLERRGQVISQGQRVFEAGLNRLVFRDVLDEGGVAVYGVSIAVPEDPVPENNAALAAVRVDGPRSILVVNHDGKEDTLSATLRAARLPVTVVHADAARLDPISLTSHRAVILENVAAGRLRSGLASLADFVTERGGGLMLTGGRAGFGLGGYHKSPIDGILPVSMELRQEQRKLGIALSVVLDRSGSMMMPVSGGMKKMDLANLGTCAAIELLSPIDSVVVTAVDSLPHVIVPLTQASDIPALTERVRGIQSSGGGIFTYTALKAAGRAIESAPQPTKHVILFADAADAEEPGAYVQLLEEFGRAGITVSVIGLGKETDVDAAFLKDVAARGKGEIYFSEDPHDLPRLFAQDTLTVSKSTFVETDTPLAVRAELLQLGEALPEALPAIGGYNLTYLRPEGAAGIVSADDNTAPIVAFRHSGVGRTLVYTGQIGGTYGKAFVQWDGYPSFAVTLARWLAGQEEPQEYFASVRRDGRDAVVTVDVDTRAGEPPDTTVLRATLIDDSGRKKALTLERISDTRFEGRWPLTTSGVTIGTVHLTRGRSASLPPMALPYSPEFERSDSADAGRELLRRVSAISGGTFDADLGVLFEGKRTGSGWRMLTGEFLATAIVLLVLEIAVRRIGLPFRKAPHWLDTVETQARRVLERAPRPSRARGAGATPPAAPPRAADTAAAPRAAPEAAAPTTPTLAETLAKARRAAGKELRPRG